MNAADDILSEVTDNPEAVDQTSSSEDSLLGEDSSESEKENTDQAEASEVEIEKNKTSQVDNSSDPSDRKDELVSTEENAETISRVDENQSSDVADESETVESKQPADSSPENKYVEVENNDGTVEVYSSIDLMKSYRERRESTGWYLSAGIENFTPIMYKSGITNETYDVLFSDESIQMTTFTVYYKWNTRVGSLGIGYEYSDGSIYNGDDDVNLDVVRTGLGFMFAFDMMKDEPKYVPYIKFHLDKHDYIEDWATDDRYLGEITGIGYGYGIGLMIQMDQFDKESARNSYAEWGLQNTFLDIAFNWQQKSSNADDQNFETETQEPGVSAALRLEF